MKENRENSKIQRLLYLFASRVIAPIIIQLALVFGLTVQAQASETVCSRKGVIEKYLKERHHEDLIWSGKSNGYDLNLYASEGGSWSMIFVVGDISCIAHEGENKGKPKKTFPIGDKDMEA